MQFTKKKFLYNFITYNYFKLFKMLRYKFYFFFLFSLLKTSSQLKTIINYLIILILLKYFSRF